MPGEFDVCMGGSNDFAITCCAAELRIDAVQRPREGDGFAHVVEAADPGHRALDAHAESGVRNRSVAPQIEIPLEGVDWQIVLLDALFQKLVGGDALRSADDFAV